MSEQQPEEQPQKTEQVCNFFRKPTKNKNLRKRVHNEDDEKPEEQEEPSVIINKKKHITPDNKLHFATGSSKRTTTSEQQQQQQQQQQDAETKASIFQFDSSKEIQVQNDSRATATLETETDFSTDARAIRERVLKQADEALKGKGKPGNDEKLYKGIHGYTDYKAGFRREQTVASEKAGGSHGPLRASAHIRVSARFDYQPDICKDYKETGYCGYGDSCKFMHDRGDYKSGWQIEREWDEAEKARKRKLALKGDDDDDGDEDEGEDDDDEDEDGLPFACFICRQPFVDPVVTKCKHYFCEHCALKMAAKPLTTAAIAMTEKKMDMSLDDIIKMSKNGTGINKAKKQRIPNKNQKFSSNSVQDRSMKLRRFMDTRSSIRQDVLGQRRTNFEGNQFPLAAGAARKAAVAPLRNSNFNRNQTVASYRPRAVARPIQNRASNGFGFAVMKQQGKVVPKQKGQTLDSLFANMKEQRMKVLSQQQQQHNNNLGRRNRPGQQRQRPPWTRYHN